jgi:hypothetical protein
MSLYSLDRSSSDTEPSSTEGSSIRCSGEPGTEDSWADPHLIYPPVQALFLFLGNKFIALLMEIQYGSGADSGVSSLSFTMLLRVCLSFLCLSSSCWRGYGRVILLGFDSCIMLVFQTLGILDS